MNTNPIDAAALWADLQTVRRQAPLVHNITNFVVMNYSANALLAVGASPVMAHAKEEVADMVGIAQALVLNIGTLAPDWIAAMQLALAAARKRGVPVVLDPVGAGATPARPPRRAASTAPARRTTRSTRPVRSRANCGPRSASAVPTTMWSTPAAAGPRCRTVTRG